MGVKKRLRHAREAAPGAQADQGAAVQRFAVDDANHSLKVPKKAGRPQAEVDASVLDTIEGWVRKPLLTERL